MLLDERLCAVGATAVGLQEFNHFRVALVDGQVERGVLVRVLVVDHRVSAAVKQQLCDVQVPAENGEVQNVPLQVVNSANAGALVEQVLHDIVLTGVAGTDQGGPAIDLCDAHVGAVFDQEADTVEVALRRSDVKGGVFGVVGGVDVLGHFCDVLHQCLKVAALGGTVGQGPVQIGVLVLCDFHGDHRLLLNAPALDSSQDEIQALKI